MIKHSFILGGGGRQENKKVLCAFPLHLTSGSGFKTVKHKCTDLPYVLVGTGFTV